MLSIAERTEKVNRRIKKKGEKSTRAKLHRILDLAIDINGLGEREKRVTGNKPTVFAYFTGHTATMDVSIHRYGWDHGSHADYSKSPHFDGRKYGDTLDEVIRDLEEIKGECDV